MRRPSFTPEELAELAVFDAAIDDADEPLSLEEWRASMRRDRGIEGPPKQRSPEARERDRIKSREHRAANAEYYREAHRAWYANNREYAKAWQREYYRTHRRPQGCSVRRKIPGEAIDAAAGQRLRELRKGLGMSQRALGSLLGVTATAVGYWERGIVSVRAGVAELLEQMLQEQAAG